MKYDVIVIGSGPAGYVATIKLLRNGLKVALIERKYLGGECTNYGCIPSKALIEVSHAVSAIESLRRLGLTCKFEYRDLSKVMDWVRSVVKRSRSGVRYLVGEADIYEGIGKIKSPHEVIVDSNGRKEVIEGNNIVIATGTDPSPIPNLEFDGKYVLSNREFFELKDIPNSILIVGAGAIGTELSLALAKLGCEVHIVEIMDRVLPTYDPDVSKVISKYMKASGIDINTSSKVSSIERKGEYVRVRIVHEGETKELEVERILVAAGRICNTYGIGLEELGIEIGKKGIIKVDDKLRTKIKNIYAIGDITGPPQLAHKAHREGLIVADVIAGKEPSLPRAPVPEVIYSHPEVASVGINESEALRRNLRALVVKYPFTAVPRDFTRLERTPDGFIKLIVEEGSGKLLGATIVGDGASELIHFLAAAMTFKLSVKELSEVIYPHPTVSECIGEVAHLALGEPIHVPPMMSLVRRIGC